MADGPITQHGRALTIATPLGEDYFLLQRAVVHEGISQLFEIEVDLLGEDDGRHKTLEPHDILGKSVTISVEQKDGGMRYFSGMVSRFSQGHRSTFYHEYYATIVPHVWSLTQIKQTRIFQHITVPDILSKIFNGYQIVDKIKHSDYKERNFCVQYRETDFDFASRLMEEEGIFYYFEHEDGMDKLVLNSQPDQIDDCAHKAELAIFDEKVGEENWVSSVVEWKLDYTLQTGKVTLWDHHFQTPGQRYEETGMSIYNAGDNQKLEMYDFGGGYCRKYDDIDQSGGTRSDLSNISKDKEDTVTRMRAALDVNVKQIAALTDCCTITPGFKFNLIQHPTKDFNQKYLIISADVEMVQNPAYPGHENQENYYVNQFKCIPFGQNAPTYRPPIRTERPTIEDAQTATVVGPGGQEIFTDKYGRVKVQFHWDRHGQYDAGSSCWVRVAQPWSGNKWGAMFIPRIGMEVLVHFINGDPDHPIITGCVYNAEAMPPYDLPDNKTRSTIKSNSSTGGGGFNEFRIEDKAGDEQIFIHAQKNFDLKILNDRKESVENDRHLTVTNNQYAQVKSDKHLHVNGDQKEKVDGSISRQAGMNVQEKAGMKYAMDSGQEIHLKAGMTCIIEAGAQLSLKVGGSFIDLNPGMVTISGAMVMINSGGSAGSGSGSSPDSPTDPTASDDDNAGDSIKMPSPPDAPAAFSPEAEAMAAAASSGTAFSGGG